MNTDNTPKYRPNSGRVWAGVVIILIGALLLLDRLNVFFGVPGWLFSWPMILIVIGLVIGGNSGFKNPAGFILLGIGAFFLLSNHTDFGVARLFWPMLIIVIGAWLLFGRKGPSCFPPHGPGSAGKYRRQPYDWDRRINDGPQPSGQSSGEEQSSGNAGGPANNRAENAFYSDMDYIDSVSVFGGVKKNIISKNFRGGEIVNIMGGADINLMQADIQGPVVLEVVQIFGGTKIIVPAHWKVHPEMAAVFGGVEDQRFTYTTAPDDTRILYIKGTSIFGGITIKSM